jgi:hypothetical protein
VSITVAQIVETDSYGTNVVIRAESGDQKIEIEVSPLGVLSLISALVVARAAALKKAGEPEPAYPMNVHRLVVGRDLHGVEFLRLYVTEAVYHDYQIPAIGQPAEALKNLAGRISGTGQDRS